MSTNKNVVSETVRKAKSANTSSLITLSTGVVLVPIRVPNMVFPEVMARLERPKPPRVFIEDIGREEENIADPDYISRVGAWQSEFSKAIVDVMIVLGTEIESIPEGFEIPESDNWTKKLAALKLRPHDEIERYLLWVKMVAAPSETDIQLIMEKVGQLSGVSEKDVSDTVDQFRDSAGR
jgi:hypothetical protein